MRKPLVLLLFLGLSSLVLPSLTSDSFRTRRAGVIGSDCSSTDAAETASDTANLFDRLLSAQSDEDTSAIAEDIWASRLKSGSPAIDLMLERAMTAQKEGNLERARRFYDRIIALKPDFAEVWNRRATLNLAEKKVSEAIRDLNEAIRLEPRHFGAWAGFGAVLESLGSTEAAIKAYQKALMIYPRFESVIMAIKRLELKKQGLPI